MGDEQNWWDSIKGLFGNNDSYQLQQDQIFNAQALAFDQPGFGNDFMADSGALNNAASTVPEAGAPADVGGFGSMQGWGNLFGGIGDIGQAYMAYKNYGLAKDQFDFSKSFANRNLSNQANMVNADLQHRAAARNSFAGNNRHKAATVDGSRIG